MSKREKHWGARGVPMLQEVSVLTHGQARAFYDWMGAKQDWQAFYEKRATRDLIAHASFETAQAVFEFGCGTGPSRSACWLCTWNLRHAISPSIVVPR